MLIVGSDAVMEVFMLTCPRRANARMRTLADLALTDIRSPDYVRCTTPATPCKPFEDARLGVLELLQVAAERKTDFILLLEDDLRFNRHIGSNINHWLMALEVRPQEIFLGSLYRPFLNSRRTYRDVNDKFICADSALVTCSQALLLSRTTALKALDEWDTIAGPHDRRLYAVGGTGRGVIYHSPSLVQHAEELSTWYGPYHNAKDFSPDWHAPREDP
jgi:hypothetical protein